MQRNQWKAASQQLLAHWLRSGISQIPSSPAQNNASATAWLTQNADFVFSEPIAEQSLGHVYDKSGHVAANHVVPSPLRPSSQPSIVQEHRPASIPAASATETYASTSSIVETKPASKTPSPVAHTIPPASTAPHSAAPNKPLNSVPSLGKPGSWNSNSLPAAERLAVMNSLNDEVIACRKCADIVCKRQRTVFGVGTVNARVVMFGEAPGADEDRVGEPFVGAAGQLLDKILLASGLKRPEVYILNALKCRPPGNRTPTEIEIENCRPFFESQLEAIQPEYIVCWGAVAVRAVLKSTESVGRLRGKFHAFRGAKVMVTYHPAYLLRTPDAKRLTWEDMKMLMKDMGIPIPNKSNG